MGRGSRQQLLEVGSIFAWAAAVNVGRVNFYGASSQNSSNAPVVHVVDRLHLHVRGVDDGHARVAEGVGHLHRCVCAELVVASMEQPTRVTVTRAVAAPRLNLLLEETGVTASLHDRGANRARGAVRGGAHGRRPRPLRRRDWQGVRRVHCSIRRVPIVQNLGRAGRRLSRSRHRARAALARRLAAKAADARRARRIWPRNGGRPQHVFAAEAARDDRRARGRAQRGGPQPAGVAGEIALRGRLLRRVASGGQRADADADDARAIAALEAALRERLGAAADASERRAIEELLRTPRWLQCFVDANAGDAAAAARAVLAYASYAPVGIGPASEAAAAPRLTVGGAPMIELLRAPTARAGRLASCATSRG